MATDQAAKRLELMKKLSADIKRIAVISNLNASGHIQQRKEMDEAAPKLEVTLLQFPMRAATELDANLEAAVKAGAQAVITMEEPDCRVKSGAHHHVCT